MHTKKETKNPGEKITKADVDCFEEKWYETLWRKDTKNEQHIKQILEKDWNTVFSGDSGDMPELHNLLDKIHHKIHLNDGIIRIKPLRRLIRYYMRTAATLFLPLIIAAGILFLNQEREDMSINNQKITSTIYAPPGSRVAFVLPDSTKGMLNGGSYISYSLPFTENRRIKLEGEAWLEVARDEEHPFEINAANSTIRVLGTSFNLNAQLAENYVEVVLKEGRIEFMNDQEKRLITLNPSERLSFQNGHVSKLTVDPAKYCAWTEGKLVFRGDTMAEVARRIEKWYNVEIFITDRELEKYSFRATFQDDSLEEVLKCLAMTSPIGYKISPRTLLPDGTYKKQEVKIFKINI